MSKRKEPIKKDNFTSKPEFTEHKRQLLEAIEHTQSVLDDHTSLKMYDRGLAYHQMLQEFLSSTKIKGRITPELFKQILRDIKSISKLESQRNKKTKEYEMLPRLDLYHHRPSIKAPRFPFVFLTFKCRTPKSNNYTSITKDGNIKPKKMRTAISNYLNSHSLSFSGITEYSLERIENYKGKKVWRSVLHYHYLVPLLSVNPDLSKEQLQHYAESMQENIRVLDGSGGSGIKVEANRQLKKTIQSVFVFVKISEMKKGINKFWSTTCNSNDLQSVDVHFSYSRNKLVPNKDLQLEWEAV